MGTILGPHVAGGLAPHFAVLERLNPNVTWILDPDRNDVIEYRKRVLSKVGGRIYVPDQEMTWRIEQNPLATARWAHERILAHPACHNVDWWQIENEVCQFWHQLGRLNEYACERVRLANGAGYGCGLLATSVGQLHMPDDDRMAYWRMLYPLFDLVAATPAGRHVMVCHGYGWPDIWGPWERGGAPWYVQRIPDQVFPRLPAKYATVQWVMGELGLDGLLVQGAPQGWRGHVSAADYADQLINIGQYLEKFSDRLLGCCIYTLGTPDPARWGTYDITGVVIERLAQRCAGSPVVTPPISTEEDVVEDPRTENCRAIVVENGLVAGVELVYRPVPSARYALVRAELIDEAAAGGNTVASVKVLTRNGIETGERVWLAWPWPDLTGGKTLSGNPEGSHMITNGYTPPDLGPLALYVGDNQGNPISDIIGGLGLPWNRHVCFRLTWQERALVTEPTPVSGPLPENEPALPVGMLADKIRWWLEESVRQDEAGQTTRAEAIRYSLIRLNGGLLYRLEHALKNELARG